MSEEEGDKENVGMVSGMSSVDIERVSRDDTTLNMSGDDSSEGEVNDRLAGFSRRNCSPEARVERGTELNVNASSGRGFLSDSSEDSDVTHRRRCQVEIFEETEQPGGSSKQTFGASGGRVFVD